MTKDLTVLIGRCSLFHNGHAYLLERAIQTSKNVLVLIGSSGLVRTIKNPFTFEERAAVISDFVKSLGARVGINPHNNLVMYSAIPNVIIMPLVDNIYNDGEWMISVQEIVADAKQKFQLPTNTPVHLTGSDRDDTTWYLNAFGSLFIKDFVTESPHGLTLNATELRQKLFEKDLNSIDPFVPPVTKRFLQAFMQSPTYIDLVQEYEFIEKYKKAWDAAPYAPIFVTTDACVTQSGHILVNIRDNFPGKGLWALPGGFLEQNEGMVDGCVRELIEETSISLSKAQLYGSIKANKIFDHPSRSLRGRTITQCFLFKLDDTKPLPKVKPQKGEVQKIMWLPFNEALGNTDKWFEDHLDMVKWGINEGGKI